MISKIFIPIIVVLMISIGFFSYIVYQNQKILNTATEIKTEMKKEPRLVNRERNSALEAERMLDELRAKNNLANGQTPTSAAEAEKALDELRRKN